MAATSELVVKICDKLALNHEMYLAYLRDPKEVVSRFCERSDDPVALLTELKSKINMAPLNNHWENAITCACRDIAIVIPD